ncbi:alpha/beta hydrolase [Yeosuana marina]|uniref:alpha/beta hydrolase n=1 Tax=Yeosuana marina TaxID=1565536 RepID=UPI0030ECFFDA|tara:strand:+ start:105 stop:1424 length:1320 start_codon:yes stop_codon:yes gene_type:complete
MEFILKQNLSIIALVFIAFSAGCQNNHSDNKDFIGVYEGNFTHGNFSTPIQIEIEKDSLNYLVYFTSPDQNAYRIPTSNVSQKGDSIYFELNSDYFSFKFKNKRSEDGTNLYANLSVDSISQNFKLKKSINLEESEIRQEDVSFKSNDLNLKGTIYFPSKPSNKVLYFVTSSGNSDRSASRAEAIKFTNQGFITFHFDKRGTGVSEGNWRSSSIEELCMDDINALKFLSKKLNIPFSNMGIKGSSQGGTKVPYILSKIENLAFGIVVSCPSTSLLESDLNYWKNNNQSTIEHKYFDEAFSLERLVFEYIGGLTTRETLEESIIQNKHKPWFSKLWIPNLDEVEIDRKLQFTPMPYFKLINQPLLIIQGTKDEIIPKESSASIFEVLKNKQNYSKVVLLTDANHSMQLVGNSDFPYWPMPHPEYLSSIYNWLNNLPIQFN